MRKKKYQGRIYYGWFVVGAGMILFASVIGIVHNCASLFVIPVCKDLGFSRVSMNFNLTIIFACTMLFAFVSGKVFSRFNPKHVQQTLSLVLCGSFFCYSFARTPALFYLISLVVGFSSAAITFVPMTIIISNWFHKKQGLALGLTFMGTGIGGMLFNVVTGYTLSAVGWRTTYQILAGIMFVFIIPCVYFIIYTKPEDVGTVAYGENEKDPPIDYSTDGFSFDETKKQLNFWLLCLCTVLYGFSAMTLTNILPPLLQDVGYSASFSANMMAIGMGVLAVGKLLVGKMYDKWPTRLLFSFAFFCVILGLVGMVFIRWPVMILVVFVGICIGVPLMTMSPSFITQEFFGRRDYVTIIGIFSALNYFGSMLTPSVNGHIFDKTGSYEPVLWVQIILMTAVLGLYQYISSTNLYHRKNRS